MISRVMISPPIIGIVLSMPATIAAPELIPRERISRSVLVCSFISHVRGPRVFLGFALASACSSGVKKFSPTDDVRLSLSTLELCRSVHDP